MFVWHAGLRDDGKREVAPQRQKGTRVLTWNNVPGVHGILVLDEAKAVHKLDFGNLAGPVGSEVSLDIGLGSWGWGGRVSGGCCRQPATRGAAAWSDADGGGWAGASSRIVANRYSPFRGRLPR